MSKSRSSDLVTGVGVKKWQLISGSVHPDGWVTPTLELRIWATSPQAIIVEGWNPEFCSKFWGNSVTVRSGSDSAIAKEIPVGTRFSVELQIKKPAEESFVLSISSKSVVEPDALDQRLRGFILRAVQIKG